MIEQSDPTDLALRLGAVIRHILVDEFQDTSHEQLALLQALTADWQRGDGRTLFVVGDPMQSIYQFREAEVGLFLRAREHGIGEIGFEALQLRLNFRSRAAVIDWVNHKFSGLFPPEDDARLARIRYLSSAAGPKSIEYSDPAVELHAFEDRDFADEAERVVQIASQARQRDPDATMAVLVASRKHATILVAKLIAAGLQVRGVELEPLEERAVVRDLTALTRALLHGADRSAWLALLHAPWCGLSLRELERLDLSEEGDLFALLGDNAHRLETSSQQRLLRLCDALRADSMRTALSTHWRSMRSPTRWSARR
jgi:ATP-dependent helicase/nuclease subunit A